MLTLAALWAPRRATQAPVYGQVIVVVADSLPMAVALEAAVPVFSLRPVFQRPSRHFAAGAQAPVARPRRLAVPAGRRPLWPWTTAASEASRRTRSTRRQRTGPRAATARSRRAMPFRL